MMETSSNNKPPRVDANNGMNPQARNYSEGTKLPSEMVFHGGTRLPRGLFHS
jgi:hypothetical protein